MSHAETYLIENALLLGQCQMNALKTNMVSRFASQNQLSYNQNKFLLIGLPYFSILSTFIQKTSYKRKAIQF